MERIPYLHRGFMFPLSCSHKDFVHPCVAYLSVCDCKCRDGCSGQHVVYTLHRFAVTLLVVDCRPELQATVWRMGRVVFVGEGAVAGKEMQQSMLGIRGRGGGCYFVGTRQPELQRTCTWEKGCWRWEVGSEGY